MASEKLRRAVVSELQHKDLLATSQFDVYPGANGARTKVAELQAGRPLAIENGKRVDLALMAYEEFTTDGTGANTETFSLSHDLVQSGATSDDIVIFEGGSKVQPDSVDYAADSFDYTDDGTNNTLGVFYASGKQALIEVQKSAPNGTHEVLWTGDMSLLHARDHEQDPVTFEFDQSFLQSVIPKDWSLELYVNAPYVTRFEKDIDSDGNPESASNALVSIPVFGGSSQVPGLKQATRTDSARR